MMKFNVLVLLAFALLASVASSGVRAADPNDDPQTLYEGALVELDGGDADAAIATLEALIAREGYAPGALVALGDAYLAKGEPGRAIVAYERALRAGPADAAAVRERLSEAYERAGEQAPSPSRARAIATVLSPEAWMGVGGAAALLLLVSALGVGLRWWRRGPLAALGAVAALALVASAVALHIQVQDGAQALVTASADARVSPIDDAEVVLTTRPGRPLELLARRGDRVQVRFRSGVVGWVPADSVATVDPRALDALPQL